jgi:hypothetical protein
MRPGIGNRCLMHNPPVDLGTIDWWAKGNFLADLFYDIYFHISTIFYHCIKRKSSAPYTVRYQTVLLNMFSRGFGSLDMAFNFW